MAAHENKTPLPSLHVSVQSEQRSKSGRISPGLAFPRVFSSAEGASAESVQWERRGLSRERTESLLAKLRTTSLEAGYFARVEDATLFAEEIGALLLSGCAVLGRPGSSTRSESGTNSAGVWRWDSARGVLSPEEETPNMAHGDDDTGRVMALDDPDLATVLAGREDDASEATRLVLVLPEDLLLVAERDAEVEPGDDPAMHRSGARDLLICIAQAVLRRGKLDLLFRETARRAEAFASEGAEGLDGASAGSATIDVTKLLTKEGRVDLEGVRAAAALLVTALEAGIDQQTYARETTGLRAHNERRISIGVANLDNVLVAGGVDLHSDEARRVAACMAALVSGEGLWQSGRIAETCPSVAVAVARDRSRRAEDQDDATVMRSEQGGCPAFRTHADEVLGWLRMQRASAYRLGDAGSPGEEIASLQDDGAGAPLVRQMPEMIAYMRRVWDGALLHAERFGLRHLGVTGAGGNEFFPARKADEPSAPGAASPEISLATQIRLRAAAQPFVHAAEPWRMVSPEGLSPEQLREVVLEAWRCGLKGISVELRRSGRQVPAAVVEEESEGVVDEHMEAGPTGPGTRESVVAEPVAAQADGTKPREGEMPAAEALDEADGAVSMTKPVRGVTLADAQRAAMERGHATLVETQLDRISELEEQLKLVQAKARESGEAYDAKEPPRAMRHRLPAERASVTHMFAIAGHEGHITVGLYPNGSPGEIFLRMTKEGSAVAGLLDSFATAVSLALQHGVPVRLLAQQFGETRFEPSGATENEKIPYALSIMDYLFRWIELRFLSGHQMDLFANLSPTPVAASVQGGAVRVTGTVSGPKSSVVPNVPGVRSAPKQS